MKIFNIFLLLIFMNKILLGQDFSNLSKQDNNFKKIEKDIIFQFPKDHGSHPNHRIEWWYFTSNLKDEDNKDLGIQWTLFRFSNHPPISNNTKWFSKEIWMGHIALTTEKVHYYEEKVARGGVLQAGVISNPFSAWIDDWEVTGENWNELNVVGKGKKFSFDINLKTTKPLVFHGDNGYSTKSYDGKASAYYSQPFFEANGSLIIDGKYKEVKGTAWADREWSSQFLNEDQIGWDWFSLNFENEEKLMLFQVREEDKENFTSGSLILPDGKQINLENKEIQFEPLKYKKIENKKIPIKWKIVINDLDIDIIVETVNQNSYLKTIFPYWEGPILVKGNKIGNGYLEMTGY